MNRKKLALTAVVLAMVLCFTSCNLEQTPNKRLVGQWQGTVDITQQLTEVPGIAESGVTLSGIGFDLIFSFSADGTFAAIVDEYSVQQMVEELTDIVVEALYDTAAQQGISGDELRRRVEAAINMDEIIAPVRNSFQNGYYVFSKGVIYLSSRDYLKLDPSRFAQEQMEVELSKNLLRINKVINNTSQNGALDDLLPLVMKKQ